MGLKGQQSGIGRLIGILFLQFPPLQGCIEHGSQALLRLRQLLRAGVDGVSHLDRLPGLQHRRQRLALGLLVGLQQLDRDHGLPLFHRNRHLTHALGRSFVLLAA